MSARRAIPSQPAPAPQQPQEESCLSPAGGSAWGLFIAGGSRPRALQNTVLTPRSRSPVVYPNTSQRACPRKLLFPAAIHQAREGG